MSGPDDWRQPERWRPEPQEDLEAEMRRLVALTHEAQGRRESLERRIRSRLEGYVSASDWMERAASEREINGNGNGGYPAEWSRLADEARQRARQDRKGARPGRTRPDVTERDI